MLRMQYLVYTVLRENYQYWQWFMVKSRLHTSTETDDDDRQAAHADDSPDHGQPLVARV